MKWLPRLLTGLLLSTLSLAAAGQLQKEAAEATQQASQKSAADPNEALRTEFPLLVEVSKSQYDNPFGDDSATLAKAEENGLAPPLLVVLTSTINEESHWTLICRREKVRNETNACTPLAAGKYPARWIHNGELLQLPVKNGEGKFDGRFFDVSSKRQDPPQPDDKLLRTTHYQLVVEAPNGKRAEDYPMLLHVYGAVRLRLPAGSLPSHARCTFSIYSPYTTQMDCVNSGGIEIYKGHVDLDSALDGSWGWTISCDAKWRWSKCAALGPGFYAARWRCADRQQIAVLAEVGGKPEEITFDAKKLPDLSEPPTARPPAP
jgi:hypothetical protein